MDNPRAGIKAREAIWDADALLAFHNTFKGTQGEDTFVNILYELGFFDDELGQDSEGNITLESSIKATVLRNFATTLIRRLAHNDVDTFNLMLQGLLKGVTRIKKEKQDG